MTNMATIKIKDDFIGKIRRDDALKLSLAQANDVKVSTIDRWLRGSEHDIILTTATNLEIIRAHFGLLESAELLEEEVVKA